MNMDMVVIHRYRDGYRVASWLASAGLTLKIAAWVVGGLFVSLAITGSQSQNEPLFGGVQAAVEGLRLFFTISIAILGWLFFFISGVIFSAIGQILRATLDTAVNTSPFMGEEAKSIAMSLPVTITSQT